MKSASKIMYTIGRVFNIFAIVIAIVILAVGIAFTVSPDLQQRYVESSEEPVTLEMAKAAGVALIISGAVMLVVYGIVCALAGHARKALNNGRKDNAPHIMMIIVGIFGDIFYLLGGIFGLVSESEEERDRQNRSEN